MPSPTKTYLLLAVLSLTVSLRSSCAADTDPGSAQVTMLDRLVRSNDLSEAMKVARRLDAELGASIDLTLSHGRLAYALKKSGNLTAAAEFFQRSMDASERPSASKLQPKQIVVIQLAAASVFAQTQHLSEAIESLHQALSALDETSEGQKKIAVSIALRVGSTALSSGSTTTAMEAYAIAVQHADAEQMPSAILGDGWASAVARKDPLKAAQKLANFIEQYPTHADASRAARACAECLKQAGREDDATTLLTDLLQRWPDSEAAFEVVSSHADIAIDLVPDSIRDWMMKRARANDLERFDVKLTTLAMLVANENRDFDAWGNLSQHLATIDKTGQATSDLLAMLVSDGNEAEAEQLASRLIASVVDASEEGSTIQPAVAEAACRWAGRTQRWSLLALAAESEGIQLQDSSRTVAVERLLAEALTQTGRIEPARTWWNHLVDTRGATDFATLLRCAESETSSGHDAELAERRISDARDAAGNDSFRVALVDLLDAELAVRRLRFDPARSLLEHVVRTQEIRANLRGRAQFLIGETHYLQHNFANAIEAYRRVEGIDPGGIWVSASLVQAGKSFEQLGRTREAAICYGNLVGRFADTAHASIARRRLAAIAPGQQKPKSRPDASGAPDISNPTIRR